MLQWCGLLYLFLFLAPTAWSSLLIPVPCFNSVVFFTYSCSMLQQRGLLYLFLFHAPLIRGLLYLFLFHAPLIRGLLYLFLFHAPMAWSSLLILVPCSNGVVFFDFSCSMLQWRGLLCLSMFLVPLAWSPSLFLFHAPLTWSSLLILVPCSNSVVFFAYSCSMLQ
jgi:hypothetical protein